MRARAVVVAAALAGTTVVPFAAPPAFAVTTTSTVVAYVADHDGNGRSELFTRAADGSGSPRRLFTTPNRVWLPALSPDGTRIAYLEDLASAGDFRYRLFVRATDGTGAATLLSAGDVRGPSWSPDGHTVIFSRYNDATGVAGVYRVAAAGGPAYSIPTTKDWPSDEPSYSPSARQVAVTAYHPTNPFGGGIDLVTIAAGNRARIAGTAGGSDPVWSPDGQYLLFQKFLTNCGVGLYRVPVGGGTPVPIRVVPGYFVGSAEYSRDGSQLFWNETRWLPCNPGTKTADIMVAKADGSRPVRLAATTLNEYSTTVAGGTPHPRDTTPPAPPVTTVTVGESAAVLAWPTGGDATEFAVVRKPHGDPAPVSSAEATVYRGGKHAATTTNLTRDAAYDFYVYATDASGNEAAVSGPHPFRAVAKPLMRSIPMLGPKRPDTTFTVGWTGGAPPYRVEVGERVRTATGALSAQPAFKVLRPAEQATSFAFTGGQGRSYYFKASSGDDFGNRTYTSEPTVAHVPLDERWSGLGYSAGWVSAASSGRFLGTYRYTNAAGRTITTRTDTGRFILFGDRCPTCGEFDVYLDGEWVDTVDTHGSVTKIRQGLWWVTFDRIGRHTLTIVTRGTKGRPRVAVDALLLSR